MASNVTTYVRALLAFRQWHTAALNHVASRRLHDMILKRNCYVVHSQCTSREIDSKTVKYYSIMLDCPGSEDVQRLLRGSGFVEAELLDMKPYTNHY